MKIARIEALPLHWDPKDPPTVHTQSISKSQERTTQKGYAPKRAANRSTRPLKQDRTLLRRFRHPRSKVLQMLAADGTAPDELPRMRPLAHVPKAISFHPRNGVLGALRGINMVHQAHKGLPEPGDYRPGSWRDVVGLGMALVGLALIVGMMLTM